MKLANLFRRPEPQYTVVEVEKLRPTTGLEGEELRNALVSLYSHPGFVYVLQRLYAQKQLLRTRLESTKFEKTEDASLLQQGVFWVGWVEREMKMLAQHRDPQPKLPTDADVAAFREIDGMLERVGSI